MKLHMIYMYVPEVKVIIFTFVQSIRSPSTCFQTFPQKRHGQSVKSFGWGKKNFFQIIVVT